jgi:hypothetical protein
MLNLIDRAASWWLNRRIEAQAAVVAKDTGVKFHKASMTPDGFNIVLVAPDLLLLIEQAAKCLNHYNAPNYIQFEMIPRLDRSPRPRPIRVTIQWMDGESPSEQNARLRAEVEALKAKLDTKPIRLSGLTYYKESE